MAGPILLPAMAALLMPGSLAEMQLQLSTPLRDPLAADSVALASALSGRHLDLTFRAAGLALRAEARPMEGGCATMLAAGAADGANIRSRLLRWTEMAWSGTLDDGRVLIAFYESEGRLPGDRLVFAPEDATGFHAALARVSETCRGARADDERIVSGEHAMARSCYFARLPELELVEAVGSREQAESTRAVVTVLSEETPEAELRLLAEHGAAGGGDGWGRPEVAFTIAGPALERMRIASVQFAFDGEPVAAPYTIALYNGTRVRIRMGAPTSRAPASGADGFYQRLADSSRATVTLLDDAGARRAVLNFEAGSALASARRALQMADWSCASAAAMPAPAAQWRVGP